MAAKTCATSAGALMAAFTVEVVVRCEILSDI
jgi:hypothetical protein